MAEPRALEGMQWDDRQQLKEAVCDAVLERTRRVVSGEGAHGAAVLGEKPSRVLSSAFILPRLNEDGDDEFKRYQDTVTWNGLAGAALWGGVACSAQFGSLCARSSDCG